MRLCRPPRRIDWFPVLPGRSAWEDGRSYPHHQNNLGSNISCKKKNKRRLPENTRHVKKYGVVRGGGADKKIRIRSFKQ